MANEKVNEAARNLVKNAQETSKALADSAISAQERNLAFAQNVLENGIEVLKSHAESSRTLLNELVEQARQQQLGPEGVQALVNNAIAAQERNTKLAQSVLENGISVLKSQVGATQSLWEELGQQFQKQQDAFQTLAQESMEAYKDFIFAPLTFWRKALDATESASLEGLKSFQRATLQGMETFQRTARQVTSATEKAEQQTRSAARKATE